MSSNPYPYPRVEKLKNLSLSQMLEARDLVDAERKIPYHITLDPHQLDISTWNDCMGKHVRLQKALSEIGVETFFGVWGFRWSDCVLPAEVLFHVNAANDNSEHVSLLYRWSTFEDGESLRILDATWWMSLATGCRVAMWDGKHGTSLTVLPTTGPKVLDPRNEEDMEYMMDTSWVAEDLAKNAALYHALNKHCATFRHES